MDTAMTMGELRRERVWVEYRDNVVVKSLLVPSAHMKDVSETREEYEKKKDASRQSLNNVCKIFQNIEKGRDVRFKSDIRQKHQ